MNPERHFKAVVIGGGPAGSSAAFTLAARGIDTCLIDRSDFPRDKLCGGLLTLRSKTTFERVFSTTWDDVIEVRGTGISFWHGGRRISGVTNESGLFFTQRFNFDNFLLQRAEKQGASLLLNRTVKSIDTERGSISLADGSIIRFDYLIGADGIKSVVARSLFGSSFDRDKIWFGLEVDVPADEVPNLSSSPEIHFGDVRWGYGWVFPKRQSATIGLGGVDRRNPKLVDRFREFLTQRCGRLPAARIKGHFLPFGDYRSEPGQDNILLAGDAAGLADSITGEGIAFAMQSGDAAAAAIADHALQTTNRSPCELYAPRYRKITDIIDQSNRYRYLIYPPAMEKLFVKALPSVDLLQRGYMDILADKIGYDALPRLLRRQAYAAVRRKLRAGSAVRER